MNPKSSTVLLRSGQWCPVISLKKRRKKPTRFRAQLVAVSDVKSVVALFVGKRLVKIFTKTKGKTLAVDYEFKIRHGRPSLRVMPLSSSQFTAALTIFHKRLRARKRKKTKKRQWRSATTTC